jgi:hypothetical protein
MRHSLGSCNGAPIIGEARTTAGLDILQNGPYTAFLSRLNRGFWMTSNGET